MSESIWDLIEKILFYFFQFKSTMAIVFILFIDIFTIIKPARSVAAHMAPERS